MSTKHNTKHRRGRSHYPDRLKRRGLKAAPRLRTLYELRKNAGCSEAELREVRDLS